MFMTRDEARELDRRAMDELGIPDVVLMENAGRGMAELLRSLGIEGTAVICCGKGNNGGDGLVIARHLNNAGVRVRVLLFADPEVLTGAAAINYRIISRMHSRFGEPVLQILGDRSVDEMILKRELASADWIVDALFGSGLRGPLRPPYDGIVNAINAGSARVFAVDIPSGLDSDTGQPLGATVRATHTATVVAPKKGFGEPVAQEWLGRVHVVDMGAPPGLLAQ